MPAMSPDQFVELFGRKRASAILRTPIAEAAAPAMEAAVRGGFDIVEFTMTTPGVLDLVREFSQREGLVVGVGTVLTSDQAHAAVDAGATFLVSPVTDEAVIETAHSLGVAVMPGAHTPTEMLRAHRAGAQLQKLFPAPGIGADYIRACLGPLPFLRIVPTNGVTVDNAQDHFAAGAFAAGFVTPVFDAQEISDGRFDLVENRARAIIGAVRAA